MCPLSTEQKVYHVAEQNQGERHDPFLTKSQKGDASFTMESQLAVLINIVNEIKRRDTGFRYMAIPSQEWQVPIADICHPFLAI